MKTYHTNAIFQLNKHVTEANHLSLTKPSNYLLLRRDYLLEAASLRHNKSSKWLKKTRSLSTWQLVLPGPGFAQFKAFWRE